MHKKKAPPPKALAHAFEMGYYSAMNRLRRDLPAAWRAKALEAVTRDTLGCEVEDGTGENKQYGSHVRGIKLILLRCEAAATMLNWRKELTEGQKAHLKAAVDRLQTAASRLVGGPGPRP
jgi:hypothetical protein